jgi:hypothetical protein
MSQALQRWLSARLTEIPSPDALTVRHADADSGGSELVARVRKIPSGDPVVVARDVAASLWEQAREHAGAFPGRPQRYRVSALSAGQVVGSFPVLVRAEGRGVSSPTLDGSEPPTPGGLLAQHMRFTEGFARMALESQAATIDAQRRELEHLRAHNDRLLEARARQVELCEQLQTMQVEREIMVENARAKREHRTKLVDAVSSKALPQLGRAVGPLLAKVLGRGPDVDTLATKLSSVLAAIPASTMEKLMAELDPAARADLEEITDVLMAARKASDGTD